MVGQVTVMPDKDFTPPYPLSRYRCSGLLHSLAGLQCLGHAQPYSPQNSACLVQADLTTETAQLAYGPG